MVDAALHHFHSTVPEEALDDLRHRLQTTRWPEKETVSDSSQGVQLATMQQLADYWANEYDWRKIEARLNALPMYMTEIDGLNIHFIHVRSKHDSALPLIITHGWPGSIIEQLKIIEPLTDPTIHGGKAEDAFHLVIPSMPGYGFSGKPTATGWDPTRIGQAWVTLMNRLGYTRFVHSGGDWGALIGDVLAASAPPELLGIHTNLPFTVPPDIAMAARAGAPPPSDLSTDERRAYDQLVFFFTKGLAYAVEMGSRPQTLYGIVDSPAGLAAWILDHDAASYEHIAELFAGKPFGDITRDDILDNITLYWLTNTGVSSARLYWENKVTFFAPQNISIPVAVSAFPEEIYTAPRSWAEKAYHHLMYYNQLNKGGHFAAWEQPELFTAELRAAFRSLRSME